MKYLIIVFFRHTGQHISFITNVPSLANELLTRVAGSSRQRLGSGCGSEFVVEINTRVSNLAMNEWPKVKKPPMVIPTANPQSIAYWRYTSRALLRPQNKSSLTNVDLKLRPHAVNELVLFARCPFKDLSIIRAQKASSSPEPRGALFAGALLSHASAKLQSLARLS